MLSASGLPAVTPVPFRQKLITTRATCGGACTSQAANTHEGSSGSKYSGAKLAMATIASLAAFRQRSRQSSGHKQRLASICRHAATVAYPPTTTDMATFCEELLEAQRLHAGETLLSVGAALRLVKDTTAVLRAEETLVRLDLDKVVVVGDLHGQFHDLLHIFELAGKPSPENPYLFNGDFVDRGSNSLEVIFTLFALKLRFPKAIHMNRGNHEAVLPNIRYGFADEIRARYGAAGKPLFEAFSEAFRWLPLAHVLNSEVFVVHGGLPGPDPREPFKDDGGGGTGYEAVSSATDGTSAGRRGPGQKLSLLGYNPDNVSLPPRREELRLEDIAALPRGGEPATDLKALEDMPKDDAEVQRLIVDLLWADPRGKTGYGPSFRVQKGCYIFGPDVTEAFIKRNGLRLVIRSHEVKNKGYDWTHPSLITVFSAPNYLGHAQNKGAVVVLERDAETGRLEPSFIVYEASAKTVYKMS
eukprot:CAMPEP_0115101384 /NCGR_PEP_ID=MMETSP0227-20121206/33196_1 /TAXON_ID=89957 /ORGANISM="Polarella glacialis, Strain CCMP 1383" /LENGTH=471 /DNA_ID=CAMNT_0002497117 /DNA_START=101 /DNA_END=1516 /DNA_ORIENTATION=-